MRHRSSPAPPLEDDNLLSEILLRLPPQPSSLPRASAVCRRWRGLASDPAFSRRFRRHHRRSPPLLGFFQEDRHGLSFVPTLDAPDRVPPGRFSSLQLHLHHNFPILGSRHGLVLIFDDLQLLVWDPVTGQQHRLPVPPGFEPTKKARVQGTVLLCSPPPDAPAAAAEHFKVVLVQIVAEEAHDKDRRCRARVYSSETGVWGKDLISPPFPPRILEFDCVREPAVLVGDSLHWNLSASSCSILEFDLERKTLSVIPLPPRVHDFIVIRAQGGGGGGGLGFLSASNHGFTVRLWKRRNADSADAIESWERGATIQLDKLFSLDSELDVEPMIYSYAEENNSVLVRTTSIDIFTLQLESLEFKRFQTEPQLDCQTFESVYAAGI